ncbi:hypothetical protein V5O48_012126 [Marasmius crinis-equi]|uniref:Uncharacterized protein n=1 Tax=Marasmius crinis-equi TaxID=585013 RepID=A0ABR3F3Y0_9AGAR
MPFPKPAPLSASSSSTTTTTSSSDPPSFLLTPPRTATSPTTPPTTQGKSSISKSKQILPRALNIPQLFRSASSSLPPLSPREKCPPSPTLQRASTMTRHFSNLRRLSFPKPAPRTPLIAQIPERSFTEPPKLTPRPMKNESRCLQHIAYGIYVAFEDDMKTFGARGADEELRTEEGTRFTHIINIVRATDILSPPTITYMTDRFLTKHLYLSTLPRPHDQYEYQMGVLSQDPELTHMTREQAAIKMDASYFAPEKTFTLGDNGVARLGSRQMVAAKEFIRTSGAGPGTAALSTPKRTASRVLITAPRDHRTDVMSIVACFLSMRSGSCPAEVVNNIDRQRGIKSVWQGCISRVGVEYIQEVC